MPLMLDLPDESATQRVGAALGRALGAHPGFVTLAGDLGAGKTTLVRAALRALGHQGAVRSPTYTLIESYSLESLTVHHLDCYRLGGDDELDALGFRDLLGDGQAVLLEWPERVTRELGQEWETLAVGFKPYASVASMHAALYSLREIMREHALTADDISSIHAGVHRMTHVHCAWGYKAHDVTEAQMNLFYGLAVMAVDGDAFIEQYREERRSSGARYRAERAARACVRDLPDA